MAFTPSPSQQRAIRHKDGPLLVLAGPGSGKTAVMIRRLQHLIETHHVPPEQILAISFTKASAQELSARFLSLTAQKYPQVTIRTFHSLFYAILKNFYGEHLPRLTTAQHVLKEISAPSWTHLPMQELVRMISEMKTGIFKPEMAPFTDRDMLIRLYTAYERALRHETCIDLDDLLIRTKALLAMRPQLLQMWQEQFAYILIDEFQDISKLQFEVIDMLAGANKNVFAVGDDDQAIYRFRGADAGFMLDFRAYFPNAQIQLLETNYRCPDTVVNASVRLISHNRKRYQKAYKSVHKNGLPIRTLTAPSVQEEAALVVQLAKQHLSRKRPAGAFAVLVRNHRQLLPLVSALRTSGVPYVYQQPEDAEREGIRLLTMHGAKGLEFDEVVILDVNEGYTPYARGGIVLHTEEERRLFYVAVTRTKKQLTLITLDTEQSNRLPSRFLKEMQPGGF